MHVLRSAPPHTGSPGRFGPGTLEESEKSPERAPRGKTPKSRKNAPRSLSRVRKVSESEVLDYFRTLLRPGALFRDFWGPASGNSFWILFGLFRTLPGFRLGPGDPVWGRPDRNARAANYMCNSRSISAGITKFVLSLTSGDLELHLAFLASSEFPNKESPCRKGPQMCQNWERTKTHQKKT